MLEMLLFYTTPPQMPCDNIGMRGKAITCLVGVFWNKLAHLSGAKFGKRLGKILMIVPNPFYRSNEHGKSYTRALKVFTTRYSKSARA